ncbi:alpha/beta hydrolase [Saccharomonospora piscinae]|uniref:poly(ethylene terephthalate) hydrolase family protein n=1 Tax=Saccharomonospora piscinae TaxID=687388 RepID=UPI00046647D9|nr:alpha/beta hydrolase [Saccharomonospora piscinae]
MAALMRRAVAAATGVVVAALLAPGAAGAAHETAQDGGTGPYPAAYETVPGLPEHTVYRPEALPSDESLPIVAWGNGACRADGTWFENILTEFASHGFLVIANGTPGGSGRTSSDMPVEAVDWAVAENADPASEFHGRLDPTKIAVMGQSCGGLETMEVADDPRITTTVMWNSGIISPFDKLQLRRLHAPIAYFAGGEDDIAYDNAMDDWDRLPTGLEAFMGNLDVGHFGTYDEPNGGEFGRVGSQWLKWQLKGDAAARAEFVGPNCGLCSTEWDVRQKNLG